MATLVPPKSKRQKLADLKKTQEQHVEIPQEDVPNIVVILRASDTGQQLGSKIFLPATTTPQELTQIVNKLLGTVRTTCMNST